MVGVMKEEKEGEMMTDTSEEMMKEEIEEMTTEEREDEVSGQTLLMISIHRLVPLKSLMDQ